MVDTGRTRQMEAIFPSANQPMSPSTPRSIVATNHAIAITRQLDVDELAASPEEGGDVIDGAALGLGHACKHKHRKRRTQHHERDERVVAKRVLCDRKTGAERRREDEWDDEEMRGTMRGREEGG